MLLNKRIPIGYILRGVKFRLLFVLVIGTGANIVSHRLPEFFVLPISIPAFLGTAISILLSFKMSQSYDRWWEARKVWGAIVNDSRSFVIQLLSFLESSNELVKTMAYRQIAWCYALGQSLRGQDPMKGLQSYFSKEDLERLGKIGNKPLGILQLNAQSIRSLKRSGSIDTYTHMQLDSTLVRLTDSMGKAERINNTVFPPKYRWILNSTIYLFVILLSISMGKVSFALEVPLLFVISLVFFLLESSATHLQDPFRNRPSDTAVTTIARNIEINIRELLEEKEIPEPYPANKYYTL